MSRLSPDRVEVTAEGEVELPDELHDDLKEAVLSQIRGGNADPGPFDDAAPSDFELEVVSGSPGRVYYTARMEVSSDAE